MGGLREESGVGVVVGVSVRWWGMGAVQDWVGGMVTLAIVGHVVGVQSGQGAV